MKKVLFIFVFLASSSVSFSQTNVYHAFPDSAVWYGEFWSTDCSGFCYCAQTWMYGDTVIGTHNYIKTIGGAIRQDIPQKKVYCYDYSDQIEHIQFDFNLATGDRIYPNQWLGTIGSPDTLVVTAIDSINIAGNYRKMFTLTGKSPDQYHIAEGIGNMDGLGLTPLMPSFATEYLKCFQSNGQLLLSNSSAYCNCTLLVSTNEINLPDHKFSIFPNPFVLSTQIILNKSYHNIALEVYDLQGKLVTQNQYQECDKIILNRGKLNDGLYFLKLILDDRVVATGKIVVSE